MLECFRLATSYLCLLILLLRNNMHSLRTCIVYVRLWLYLWQLIACTTSILWIWGCIENGGRCHWVYYYVSWHWLWANFLQLWLRSSVSTSISCKLYETNIAWEDVICICQAANWYLRNKLLYTYWTFGNFGLVSVACSQGRIDCSYKMTAMRIILSCVDGIDD